MKLLGHLFNGLGIPELLDLRVVLGPLGIVFLRDLILFDRWLILRFLVWLRLDTKILVGLLLCQVFLDLLLRDRLDVLLEFRLRAPLDLLFPVRCDRVYLRAVRAYEGLDDLAVPELVGDDVPAAVDRDLIRQGPALDALLRYSCDACLLNDADYLVGVACDGYPSLVGFDEKSDWGLASWPLHQATASSASLNLQSAIRWALAGPVSHPKNLASPRAP